MPSIIDEKSPVPKYCQLREYLRREIGSGRLKPGDMIPTEEKSPITRKRKSDF